MVAKCACEERADHTEFPKSLRYRAGLVLAVLALPIFPLLYLSALTAPLWLLHLFAPYRHATFHVHRFALFRPFWLSWLGPQLLLYAFVFFVEFSLLSSLIKPWFASRRKRARAMTIDPTLQAEFWAFVLGICEWVGVPAPKYVEVDCGLNAAIYFARGSLGFLSRDLTLRIGLPLVTALNGRELAGVIAHEFGHFRQGSGLRLSFIIRGINRWLARAAKDRDELDGWLERESHHAQFRSAALLLDLASLTRAFSRWSLRVLTYPSQAAGSFLLRAMEYDADCYEIWLAGSASFEATTLRLATLAEAAAKAKIEMQAMWRIGRRLPENFPFFVLQHETKLPVGLRDIIQTRAMQRKTGLLDSHPAEGERIRIARAANEPGIVDLPQPASALLSDFGKLAREVTFAYYVQELGLDLTSSNLRKT